VTKNGKQKPLTEKQLRILEGVRSGQFTHSGRGGFNSAQARILEVRGLLKAGKRYTWDQEWSITEAGRVALTKGAA